MRVRFPVLPIEREEGPIRHWVAALVVASAVSWGAVFAAARMIAGLF
jgi:hypothetical protein